MFDWDDLKVVLAVARNGSVRQGAFSLGVNHSTVSRRLQALEGKIGVRVFDRSPDGYLPTAAGEELVAAAEKMEEQVLAAERQIVGRDQRLSGSIVLSLPDIAAWGLVMDDLASFCDLHPDIEIEMRLSYGYADLARREADLVVRVSNEPPQSLVGRRLFRHARAYYAARSYLARHDLAGDPKALRWIGWAGDGAHPDWVKASPVPEAPVGARFDNVLVRHAAASEGLGLAMLECFLADKNPDLVRLPGTEPFLDRELWILTHRDLKTTARVRALSEHLARGLRAKRALIEGQRPEAWREKEAAARQGASRSPGG